MKKFLWYLMLIAMCLILPYFGWKLERELNYKYSYYDDVVETVKEVIIKLVKPECLKKEDK